MCISISDNPRTKLIDAIGLEYELAIRNNIANAWHLKRQKQRKNYLEHTQTDVQIAYFLSRAVSACDDATHNTLNVDSVSAYILKRLTSNLDELQVAVLKKVRRQHTRWFKIRQPPS